MLGSTPHLRSIENVGLDAKSGCWMPVPEVEMVHEVKSPEHKHFTNWLLCYRDICVCPTFIHSAKTNHIHCKEIIDVCYNIILFDLYVVSVAFK